MHSTKSLTSGQAPASSYHGFVHGGVCVVSSLIAACWANPVLLLLLQILVELAIERQQELPALVYEARPTSGPYQRGMWRQRQQQQGSRTHPDSGASTAAAEGSGGLGLGAAAVAPLVAAVTATGSDVEDGDGSPSHRLALLAGQARSSDELLQELARTPPGSARGSRHGTSAGVDRGSRAGGPLGEGAEPGASSSDAASTSHGAVGLSAAATELPGASFPDHHQSSTGRTASPVPATGALGAAAGAAASAGDVPGMARLLEEDEESEGSLGLPDAIKLGLGDFIFYSMLVGRAAMYDMMTGG